MPGPSGQGQHPPHTGSAVETNTLPNPSPTATNSTFNGLGKIDLGLSRMQTLLSSFAPPLSIPAIHLAGTNGKGSVSALLESCFLSAGFRVARYNSPYLLEPRDAVRIDGLPPTQEQWEEAVRTVKGVDEKKNVGATVFEITTAAAYWLINNTKNTCCAQQGPGRGRGVDVMIIECGMGGARDATNVIPADTILASALTSVGLDHTAFLGETVEEITREKASIAVRDAVFVIGAQQYEGVVDMARRTAGERGAKVLEALRTEKVSEVGMEKGRQVVSVEPFKPPPPVQLRTLLPSLPTATTTSSSSSGDNSSIITQLSLPGNHQLDNLSVALTILQAIRHDTRAKQIQPLLERLTDTAIQQGVASCQWEGRCSWVHYVENRQGESHSFLVDGAHNSDSAKVLRDYIDSLSIEGDDNLEPRFRFIVSLSASPGKSIDSVLSPLLRRGDEIELVEFTTPVQGMPWIKTVPRDEVARAARQLLGEEAVIIGGVGEDGVRDALRNAKGSGRLAVVCGSLYLVADVYRLMKDEYL
ncbi:folylpolyglutamate synthase [Cryptococcus deuterogattii R265]|uniref:Folylpolyglutamate synthase n=1 Tax=Cryptococcus deuterogattii (strain R265) TaxID=294750 RepID=A0A095CG50_CRYD2|nr:folylpolyglutamate synthase [Cryptococcus deuterogattii R265]KIR71563.1 folylpolyglutamate synthase [Cryptococcus deuterogattii CA1014]